MGAEREREREREKGMKNRLTHKVEMLQQEAQSSVQTDVQGNTVLGRRFDPRKQKKEKQFRHTGSRIKNRANNK